MINKKRKQKISLCRICHCMTKEIRKKIGKIVIITCGKCGVLK